MDENTTKVKSGFVTILGKPNAGKSTLMNALLGQKLSITTSKPQTTRKRILGILTEEEYQIVFLDTPGILDPAYLLQKIMMEDVESSAKDADVLIIMIDLQADPDGTKTLTDKSVAEIISKSRKPIILILNKMDLSTQEKVQGLINNFEKENKYASIIPVAALQKFNTKTVVEALLEHLPFHPKYYPDDIVADANERFFVSEIIREKIFEGYKEEIPYSCEVLIAEFIERPAGKDYISAEIVVEKESQKGILIGQGGEALKKIGSSARTAIEEFLDRQVYLELRVKVRAKWRSDEKMLKAFGYSKDKE